MGKKMKKGKVGPSTLFISRSKAIKKLQLTLKDFRRLCILKGIYPREPPQKLRKNNKTYYHIKDINYIQHEKVLDKFREKHAHMKKVKRAIARGEKLKARQLKAKTPNYQLDHLVKERYPTFADALNDLDDALSLISLFASFPAHKDLKIPHDLISNCLELLKQFKVYVINTHSLRKVFLSIKGVYYQVQILGNSITWVEPYQVSPSMPLDVDYKIMMTFLEFYKVMLKFVNFKLLGCQLIVDSDRLSEILSFYHSEKPKNEEFQQTQQIETVQESLFKGMLFYLYPESPIHSLEFVILSFGGKACWEGDGQGITEKDAKITHVITERQVTDVKRNREYIQPQWVYDCINQLKILNTKDYGPNQILPPHLSPFENQSNEQQLEEKEPIEKGNVQEEEEENEEQELVEEEVVEKVKFDEKKAKKDMKKQLQEQALEKKHLAVAVLTRKDKKLYEMVKRKEVEKKQKEIKLTEKRQKQK